MSEASSTDRSHYEMLLERAEDDVLVVRFNRPEAANALDTWMGRDVLERPRNSRVLEVSTTWS